MDNERDYRDFKMKRQILGLTCQELADRCGITKQAISNLERGGPSSPILIRVVNEELGRAFSETSSMLILGNVSKMMAKTFVKS